MLHTGACPGGARPPPPEIEKQKKSHQSKFKAISPIFCYFCSRKYHFLCYFLSTAPLEKLKSKKFNYETELFSSSFHIVTFFSHFFSIHRSLFFLNMILAPLGELPPPCPLATPLVLLLKHYRYGSIVSTSYQHQINEDPMNIESTSIIIVSTSLSFKFNVNILCISSGSFSIFWPEYFE